MSWTLRRLIAAHGLSAIAEWAVSVGLLVHAFAWGGATAVGVASIAILVPPFVLAPFVGWATARWPAHDVRAIGLTLQAAAYSGAAASALADSSTTIVAPFVVLGLATTTVMHPTTAALLPRIARATTDLVDGNLWVTYCDSSSAFIGSLAAGLIVGAAGPETLFLVSGAMAATAALATVWRPAPLARTGRVDGGTQTKRVVFDALAELRVHPWSRGVLAISSARNIVVGALDVLLVVLALDALGLGDGGPGLLSALVGAGAVVSMLATRVAVRRARLRGPLMTAIGAAAMLAILLGVLTEKNVAYVALPLMGLCIATMDALSRTLLQRSSDPRNLGPLVAALGFVAGIGQVLGSVIAQVALALGDLGSALITLGGILVCLAIATVRSLRFADAHADVPIVEMTLLSELPMFRSLPTASLEQVARLAETKRVELGQHVAVEGEPGEACFVVADGEFESVSKGGHRRTLRRGDAFGEVALLGNMPRSSTLTARTAGSVLSIARDPFLVALTGHDVQTGPTDADYRLAQARYREVVATQTRDPQSASIDEAETWLGLGAAGRMLGDPSFSSVLSKAAQLADAGSNDALLAEAAAMTTWPGAFFFIAENPDHDMIDLCERALMRLALDDPLRVRVLATLASHLTFASEPSRRIELITEALRLAHQHQDPALIGAVLNAEFICLWEPGTLRRREQIAASLTEIALQTSDPELEYIGGFFAAYCAAERGRLVEARQRLIELRPALPLARNLYFEFLGERLILSIDIARCEPGVASRIDALAERHGHTHADTDGTWALQHGGLAYQAGTLGSMLSTVETMLEGPHARTWRAALALAELMAGDHESARRTLAGQGEAPRNYFWATVAQVQAEVAACLGATERCQVLFDELTPFRGQVGITASGSLCFALVSRSLGELALALGRTDEAIDLLQSAIDEADTIGMPFESVVSRRLLAGALQRSGNGADATRLITHASAEAATRGFAREVRLLDALAIIDG